MGFELKTNTAVKICVGPFYAVSDGVTPQLSLTVSNSTITLIAETDDNNLPTLILDNVAGNDGTNTLAHITDDNAGYYSLLITAANVNRLGRMKLSIIDTDVHVPVFHEIQVLSTQTYDAKYGTGSFSANVTQWEGHAVVTHSHAEGMPVVETHFIQADVIDATAIKDAAITDAKLGADCITEAKIKDNAFANEHFAAGALTSAEITSAAGCVVASIANGAITAAAIATDAIDDDAIATGAIASTAFAAGAINAAAIAADAIELAKIKDGAISAAKFAANAITSTVVADDFITAAKIATDALAADGLAADAVTEINAAVLSAISGIGSGTGAALNFAPDDDNVDGAITSAPTFDPVAPFVGTQTSGTYASVAGDDGTYHQIDDGAGGDVNEIDIIYQFKVGTGRTCSKVVFTGYMGTGTGDTCVIKAYNFLTGAWDTRSTLIGQTGSTDKVQDVTLLAAHTGTGTHAGKVYIRFDSTATNQVLYVDSLIAQAQNAGALVGYADGAIWIGGSNANTTPYIDGTADNPCTYAASKTLSASIGITRFRVRNNTTITLDATIANETFIGKNWTLALGTQAVTNAYIEGATVSGVSSGTGSTFLDCKIGTCTINSTTLLRCTLTGTLTTIASGAYNFIQCVDGIPGETNAVLVFTANAAVGFRLWSGGINLNALAATNIVVIDGSGKLILDSNCVAGEIRLRGPFAVTDNVVDGFLGTLTQSERLTNTELIEDILRNQMDITDATGAVSLKNDAGVEAYTGSVTDNSATTTRTRLA